VALADAISTLRGGAQARDPLSQKGAIPTGLLEAVLSHAFPVALLTCMVVASLSTFIGVDGTNTTLNSGRMLINLKPLAPASVAMKVPAIPVSVPSELLERRPDTAAAERSMAAANAQIASPWRPIIPPLP
jgi:hypothetical protein